MKAFLILADSAAAHPDGTFKRLRGVVGSLTGQVIDHLLWIAGGIRRP